MNDIKTMGLWTKPLLGRPTLIGLGVVAVPSSIAWVALQRSHLTTLHQVLAHTAFAIVLMAVTLATIWRVTRAHASAPGPNEYPARPHRASLFVFTCLVMILSKFDRVVGHDFAVPLHLSVLALAAFVGWLTYRLLVPCDARDAARNWAEWSATP